MGKYTIQSLEVRGKSKGLEVWTLPEVWDSGSTAIVSKGQSSVPPNRKHLGFQLGAGPENLMDSGRCFLRSCLRSQRCHRSWEGGRDFRGRAWGRGWLGNIDLWQLILTLSYPTQEGCKKHREIKSGWIRCEMEQLGDVNFDFQGQQQTWGRSTALVWRQTRASYCQ